MHYALHIPRPLCGSSRLRIRLPGYVSTISKVFPMHKSSINKYITKPVLVHSNTKRIPRGTCEADLPHYHEYTWPISYSEVGHPQDAGHRRSDPTPGKSFSRFTSMKQPGESERPLALQYTLSLFTSQLFTHPLSIYTLRILYLLFLS